MKQINKFLGVDSDTNLSDIKNTTLRASYNVHLFEDGSKGSITNFKGAQRILQLGDSSLSVLGSTQCWGNVRGERKECIVWFLYDDVYRSKIILQDVEENRIYQLFPNPAFSSRNELGWDADTQVDATVYSDRTKTELRWVDGKGPIRSIEVKVEQPQSYPSIRSLHKRPLAPQGEIKVFGVNESGNLVGGSYVFGYRLYNSETCKFSKISCLTPSVKIPLSGNCGPEGSPIVGSSVQQDTGKEVTLLIDTQDPDFDSVQIVVIKNTDGSKENQSTGYLLKPSKELYGGVKYFS